MADLDGFRVAVLAGDGVERIELTWPVQALREKGAVVQIVAPQGKAIQAFNHFDKADRIPVDHALADVSAEDFDGLVLPGGALNGDQLRAIPEVKEFLRKFDGEGKPIAAICHAPWTLVSAGLVKKRTLTSYHTLADDVRNAGGQWVDREVVRDANWVTSRKPADLEAFNRETAKLFEESRAGKLRGQLRGNLPEDFISGGSHPGMSP
jgi:protease I